MACVSSDLQLFYCYRENTTEYQVSCDLLVRENILCSSLQIEKQIEKQLNLAINKTLSSCYKIEHGIVAVPIINYNPNVIRRSFATFCCTADERKSLSYPANDENDYKHSSHVVVF